METMKATALHPSEKKSITFELTCTGSEKNEGKNKEDQLLSGTGKDRNAEDPVSEGSLHLRVSDVCEAEQDGVSVLANLDKKGTKTTDLVTEVPVESAAGRESSKSNEVVKIEEVKKSFGDKSSVANSVNLPQEAQKSGNFSVDDKKMGDRQLYDANKKSTSADTTDYRGSSCINNSYLPTKRSVRGNRWSYPNDMHNLSFYNGRIETLRYQYRLKKKRLFSESSPYNTRYYNVLPHARNRGIGRRNPYYNGKHGPVGKIKNVENPINAQSPVTESQKNLNKDTACPDMSKSLPISVKSEEEENKFVIDDVTNDDSAGTAKSVAAAQNKSPDEKNEYLSDVDKKPKDCENDGGTSERKSAVDSNVDVAPPVSSEELKTKPEEDAKEAVKINEVVDNNCAVNNEDDKGDINVNSTTVNSKDVFNSQNRKTDNLIPNDTAVESNCDRELTQIVNVDDGQIVANEVNATSDICTKVNDTSAKTTDAQNIENASNASQEKTDETTKNVQTADLAVSSLQVDREGNEKQGSSAETNKDLSKSSQEILHAEDANAKTSESCDKEDKKIEASDSKEVANEKVVPAITNGVEDIEKKEDVEKSEVPSLSDASIGGAKEKLDVSTSDVELITVKPENAIAMGNDENNANDVLSKKIESSDSNIFEKKDNVVALENDVLSDTDKNDLETGSTKSTDSLIEIQTDGSSVQTSVKNVTNKKRRKRKRPKRKASRRKLTVPGDKSVTKTATTNSVKKYDKQVNTRGDKKSIDTENITVDLTGEELFETVTKNSKNTATEKSKKVPTPVGRNSRKRTLQMLVAVQENEVQEKKKEQENSRHRRRIARNAEAIIRKESLSSKSDFELISEMDKNVADKKKTTNDTKTSVAAGESSLKRLLQDNNEIGVEINVKKPRMSNEIRKSTDKDQPVQNIEDPIKSLNYVRKFYQRDVKEGLAKLTQTDLEELLIQKIVETIAMRGEIGKLREQAKISERNQETTRVRCVHLARQIKDLELVLNHSISERRSNNEKIVAPIKINRSVGLQVNFTTDGTIHNLRQLQQTMALKSAFSPNGTITPVPEPTETPVTINSVPRRGLKVRSPRRIDVSSSMPVTPVQSQTQTTQAAVSSVATPTALIVGKSSDSVHCINNFSEVATTASSLPKVNNSSHTATPRSVVLNGKLPSPMNRQVATGNFKKTAINNDLIDLTDEEEKSKSVRVTQNTVKTAVIEPEVTIASKSQTRYQKVLPAHQVLPANVAVTTQQNNIRLMTPPTNSPTPTALMVRQSSPNTKGPVSSVTYKTGVTHLENGMRLLTTPSIPNIHLLKHPAPLPDVRNNPSNPSWKLPPPAPSLKITKVLNGIVLSWNMNLNDQYAKIVSYQLYAYQEFPNVVPSSNLWKKVGDVRALQLPMACTLTQFSEGNNYHFAVRAVDAHSRLGQYSLPGNISL
ncbi:activating transcription factor 7-interacting protein 1 isoform X2 [Cephus cinctus]|uniref:Activating transcription factor 7-interacting protein 1 isoform X2 n=1 Tax=Cephus cinctus TaxID=211228 RepID=A0AAJ7RD06_CEPCN|nr:activating transcription factor 7-interacting protein 1 isoform X2 [Cephus cinctus]